MPAEKLIQFPAAKPKPRNMTSDGRRCIRMDIGTDPVTGKRKRKAFYGKTLREAQQKADEYRRLMRDGVDIAARTQTVEQWAQTWLETYGSSGAPGTMRCRRIDLARITDAIGALKLCDVRGIHIQRLADSVCGYSHGTVNHMRSLVTRLFDAAIANDMIIKNPCIGISWQSVPNGTHRALDDSEIAAILAHWQEKPIGAIVAVMLYTGLRIGEAAALQWEDVDLDAGVIHVRHGMQQGEHGGLHMAGTKTASSVRDVTLLSDARNIIAQLPHDYAPFVFKPYAAQGSYNEALRYFCKRIGLNIRFHDLRHTFATMCYRANVDVKTAQRLLGHSTPSMTLNVYTHIAAEREQTSIAALDALMGGFDAQVDAHTDENSVQNSAKLSKRENAKRQ